MNKGPLSRSSARACGVLGLALAGLAAPSIVSAQSLDPTGMEAGARVAIDRSETFRQADGTIFARLFEARGDYRRSVRYAQISAGYDCAAGTRAIQIRQEFSARRDPVKTVYDPPLIASGRDNPAVAEQLRLVCGELRRTGSMGIMDFLENR